MPGVHRYTQWEHQAHGRWHYGGSVFDGFVGVARPSPAQSGGQWCRWGQCPTSPSAASSRRCALLRAGGAIELAQGSPVETLWQTGCTPVDDLGIEASPFVPGAELEAAIAGADLVVSHAGTGSSLTALTAGRFPVLVPRRGDRRDRRRSPRRVRRELDRRGIAMRRVPAELTADDLILAATRNVKRSSRPEPFKLID